MQAAWHDVHMIAGVLLDLSGVIYVGKDPLPGAIDALERLRQMGLPLRFLTNTTRTAKPEILRSLQRMEVPCTADELFTPAEAARSWLGANRRSAHLLVHPGLMEDFSDLADFPQSAVVVGDAGEGFSYQALNAAFRQLSAGAELIALAPNRTFKDHDGELSLDAGPFVKALEFGARTRATVLGKPSPAFFQAALDSMNCRAEDAVMVGDDAEADVSGALQAGVGRALLVRTGKYQDGAEHTVDPPPTATVADLSAAVDWISQAR